MSKRMVIFLAFLWFGALASQNCEAQIPLFQKTYEVPTNIVPDKGLIWVHDLYDGGAITVAEIGSDNNLTPPQPSDVYVQRTNQSGSLLWKRAYHHRNIDYPTDVIPVDEGRDGFLICGVTSPGFHLEDVFFLRLDANGNQLWATLVDSGGMDYAYEVKQLNSSKFVAVGTLSGKGAIMTVTQNGSVTSHLVTTPSASPDFQTFDLVDDNKDGTYDGLIIACWPTPLLVRTSLNSVLWAKRYNLISTGCDPWVWTVKRVQDGYLVGGKVTVSNNPLDRDVMLLMKTDDTGYFDWAKRYDENPAIRHPWIYDLVVGEFGFTFCGGWYRPGVICNVDRYGNVQWYGTYESGSYQLFSIKKVTGGYLAAGSSNTPSDGIYLTQVDDTGHTACNYTYKIPAVSNIYFSTTPVSFSVTTTKACKPIQFTTLYLRVSVGDCTSPFVAIWNAAGVSGIESNYYWFRDELLAEGEVGAQLKEDYYDTAPAVTEALRKDEELMVRLADYSLRVAELLEQLEGDPGAKLEIPAEMVAEGVELTEKVVERVDGETEHILIPWLDRAREDPSGLLGELGISAVIVE